MNSINNVFNNYYTSNIVASEFYNYCGNAGTFRPELFSINAKPHLFYYAYAPKIVYSLANHNLYLNGDFEVDVPAGRLPWVLLHVDGNEGEMMCWINLLMLNNNKCSMTGRNIEDLSGVECVRYHVSLDQVDARMYPFILKQYVPNTWEQFLSGVKIAMGEFCDYFFSPSNQILTC